jgi:tetratricopeptide (TPR) repeat protein
LRVLFGVGFMKRSNPEAYARYDRLCREAEAKMSADLRQVAHEWQTLTPHAGGLRPITAMAARVLLRENKTAEALPLYELAQRQVPDYTSWNLEYVYFTLACRERLSGRLTETDLAEANAGIAQGRFLLAHGDSKTGLTERYVGRLHQLRGEWAEAIPYLEAARPRMRAEDLVACDQALATSYLRTGRKADAIALAEDGIQHSGSFAGIYRQLRAGMESVQPQ